MQLGENLSIVNAFFLRLTRTEIRLLFGSPRALSVLFSGPSCFMMNTCGGRLQVDGCCRLSWYSISLIHKKLLNGRRKRLKSEDLEKKKWSEAMPWCRRRENDGKSQSEGDGDITGAAWTQRGGEKESSGGVTGARDGNKSRRKWTQAKQRRWKNNEGQQRWRKQTPGGAYTTCSDCFPREHAWKCLHHNHG